MPEKFFQAETRPEPRKRGIGRLARALVALGTFFVAPGVLDAQKAAGKVKTVETGGEVFEKNTKVGDYGIIVTDEARDYLKGYKKIKMKGVGELIASQGEETDREIAKRFLTSGLFWKRTVRATIDDWLGTRESASFVADNIQKLTGLRNLEMRISELTNEEIEKLLDAIKEEARVGIEKLNNLLSKVKVPERVPQKATAERRYKFNIYGIKFNSKSEVLMLAGCKDSGIKAMDGGTFCTSQGPNKDMKVAEALLTSSGYRDLTWEAALRQWSNGGYGAERVGGIDSNKLVRNSTKFEIRKVLEGIRRNEGIALTAAAVQSLEPTASAEKKTAPLKKEEQTSLIAKARPAAVEKIESPYTEMGGISFPVAAEGTRESREGDRYAKKQWEELKAAYAAVNHAMQDYRTAEQKLTAVTQKENSKEEILEALRYLSKAKNLLLEAREDFYYQADPDNTESARGAMKNYYLAAQREVNARSAASQEYFRVWRKVDGWYIGLIRVVSDQVSSTLKEEAGLIALANRKLSEIRLGQKTVQQGAKGLGTETKPGVWRKDWNPYPPESKPAGPDGSTPRVLP